jgi:hypothetical protein
VTGQSAAEPPDARQKSIVNSQIVMLARRYYSHQETDADLAESSNVLAMMWRWE